MNPVEHAEKARLKIQDELDYAKTQLERNKLGQFATPLFLALDIVKYAKELMPEKIGIRFLDPAFGTGAFYSALLQVFDSSRIESAEGYEIDAKYGNEAKRLWRGTQLRLHMADFTSKIPPTIEKDRANLIICNPPYVRHHHLSLDQKDRLRKIVEHTIGIRLSGLSGLYCYYMCIAHRWMADGSTAGWLVPSEFMDVNYGLGLKKYLLDKVTLLRIHRFDPTDVQFHDADVSSTVVWFKNAHPPKDHFVEFTLGGTHGNPKESKLIPLEALRNTSKWTWYPVMDHNVITVVRGSKLSELFSIKRGLATGANEFFILDKEKISQYKIPTDFLVPILPMPRDLEVDEIRADEKGNPILKNKLFLLSCNLSEDKVKLMYPSLWEYLKMGLESGVGDRYLCRHRTPWYSQEQRPPAPFLCSYFGRKTEEREKPFRFILNHSNATASNSYLMLYPLDNLKRALNADPYLYTKVWECLNRITSDTLVSSGRVYGGGLHKLEPMELSNVPADDIMKEPKIMRHIKEGLF